MGADRQGGRPPQRRGQVARGVGRAAAAAGALLSFYLAFTLPPRARALPVALAPTAVPGAFHVHTSRAGGGGSVDDVAAAAAAAGLKFVVITDHGDATRLDAPAYRHGVLCIDAVEINTHSGHLIALGLPRPAPFPLAGEAADVIEDIHRLGGRAIVTHPESPRADLRWSDQDAAFDGLEWLNADTEWRDESWPRLAMTGLRAIFRGPESIVSLFNRPDTTLARWTATLTRRSVVALVGADAHARIGGDDAEGRARGPSLGVPTYRQMFGAMHQVALIDAPLSGDAGRDAAAVTSALTSGRSYSVLSGIASPAAIDFSAEQAGQLIRPGGTLDPATGAIFNVKVAAPAGAAIFLFADREVMAIGRGSLVAQRSRLAPSYRVEAYFPGFRVPWIVTNAIRVAAPAGDTAKVPAPFQGLHRFSTADGWGVERSPTSTGVLTPGDSEMRLDATLGDGAPAGQFVALSTTVPKDASFSAVSFIARATAEIRVSVQLRLPKEREQLRWRRSIALNQTAKTFTIPVSDFKPVDHSGQASEVAAAGGIDGLLFVLDTLNMTPGSKATIWLSNVQVGR